MWNYKWTDEIVCAVSFHLYIHLHHTSTYTFIYIHWAECIITNEQTRSCVLCLSTGTYIRIIYVYIHPYTYIGQSVELQIKQRNPVFFHLDVHPDRICTYTSVYIFWAECGIKSETTRFCLLCLSSGTYIRINIYIHIFG